MLAVRGCEIGLLLCDGGRAVEMTGGDLEAIIEEFVAVVVMSRLAQRPIDETSLGEAVEVFGEAIAMRHQIVSSQRREVKLVVADDPATCIPSPSLRIRGFRGFGGKPIAIDA